MHTPHPTSRSLSQKANLNNHRSHLTKKLLLISCSLALLNGCFVGTSLAQAPRVSDDALPLRTDSQQPAVFDQIPQNSREEFAKRLNLLLDYRRTERWDALYDLISNQFIRGRSRARFVEDYTKYPGLAGRTLLGFSPQEVTRDDYVSGGFIVYGCAELSGLSFSVDAHVLAARENSEWRFSDLGVLVPRHGSYTPCGYLSRSANNVKPKVRR